MPHAHPSGKVTDREIALVATDVDGTLLNSKQQLTAGVEAAVKQSLAAGVPVVVATGKARGPWAKDILPRLGPPAPGVFMQGLLIYNAQGKLIYSRDMDTDVVRDALEIAQKHGFTVTAYCGDRILCDQTNADTDRLLFYGEPTPEAVGPLQQILGKIGIQKLLLMSTQARVDEVRPALMEALLDRAVLTTAITGMLEVLPPGASKGAGVARLLQELGLQPHQLLAVGDGENDVEMLQLAGVGVAMGNAGQQARAVADAVVASNDEDGLAEAIHRFVLAPRGVALPPPAQAGALPA